MELRANTTARRLFKHIKSSKAIGVKMRSRGGCEDGCKAELLSPSLNHWCDIDDLDKKVKVIRSLVRGQSVESRHLSAWILIGVFYSVSKRLFPIKLRENDAYFHVFTSIMFFQTKHPWCFHRASYLLIDLVCFVQTGYKVLELWLKIGFLCIYRISFNTCYDSGVNSG